MVAESEDRNRMTPQYLDKLGKALVECIQLNTLRSLVLISDHTV